MSQKSHKSKKQKTQHSMQTSNKSLDPGFWIGLVLVVIFLCCTMKCS